jgi:hypothetical protein
VRDDRRSFGQAYPATLLEEGTPEGDVVAPHSTQRRLALVREGLFYTKGALAREEAQPLLQVEGRLLRSDGEPDGYGVLPTSTIP